MFQLYCCGQFIGGGNWSTNIPWENHWQTSHKQLYHIMLYQVHLTWVGFKLTMLMVIDTDCMGSYKSNYHMITTTGSQVLGPTCNMVKLKKKEIFSKEQIIEIQMYKHKWHESSFWYTFKFAQIKTPGNVESLEVSTITPLRFFSSLK